MRRGLSPWGGTSPKDFNLFIFIKLIVLVIFLVGCSQYFQENEYIAKDISISTSAPAPPPPADESEIPAQPHEPLPISEHDLVEYWLGQLSTEEKIGQLFMLRLPWQTLYADASVKSLLEEIPAGGVILFGDNVDSVEQVTALTIALQALSRVPLLIAVDEEGGRVSRVGRLFEQGATTSAYSIGQSPNPETLAFETGEYIGRELTRFGINMNFAPVADVWSNPKNEVIGQRAFGREAEAVSFLVELSVQGLHAGGAMAVVKHFPGHGDTYEDSHFKLAVYHHPLNRFNEKEALPFISGITAGAEGVMVGHITTPYIGGHSPLLGWMQPYIDSGKLPATFSDFWLQTVLRGEMGFNGLIITDALEMRALTDRFNCGQIALGAFLAGADILLLPHNLSEAFETMLNGYRKGLFNEERLNQSVRRILRAKIS